jgi:lysophospholipase L1-like esterase
MPKQSTLRPPYLVQSTRGHTHTRGVWLRVIFMLAGLGLIVGGALTTEVWLAAHLAPNGHITEVAYVYVLRGLAIGIGSLLAILALRTSARTLQNCVLMMAMLGVTLGGLEATLRIVDWFSAAPHHDSPTGLQASAYPELFYENTPNFREDGEQKFNSLGMRDDERVLPADRPTVVVVGDSIEAWRAVPIAELYPRRLEAMLHTQPGTAAVQVLNFGVTGYSLHQKRLMLQYRGLAWQPRLAIVGYCLNDPIPAWELVNYFTHKPHRKLWRSIDFLNTRVRSLLHPYGLDFYHEAHRPGTPTWNDLVEDFHTLGQLATQQNFKVILVIFPLMVDTPVGYPWLNIHHRVTDVATQNGLEVIDLLDRYRAAGFSNVRDDTVHPNTVGHRIAAEALYAAIMERHLLAFNH